MSNDLSYYGVAVGFVIDAAIIIYFCHRRGMTLTGLTDTIFSAASAIYKALRKCARW